MSCGCQTSSSNCVREPFNANFVRPLTYVRGVDANGCVSYAPATSFLIAVQDTNTVDLTLASGVLSAQARVSTNAGNALQALANGLFVPVGAGLQIADTNTVDLTLAGGVLSARAIISPNVGNVLQALPNGLFVPTPPFVSIQDTTSVDLTLAGGVLSANVVISTNAGNQLQLLPNGLYVAPSTFSLTVNDTNTVDLNLVGGNLTANVIVSPNAGNALQVLPNGLFVPAASSISIQDTNSVDLTLTGGVLSADVIISPNFGNALQLLPNGLFVPAASSISIQDTNSVDLTLTGGVLSADVIISPNVGNALQALPNGLFVPSASFVSIQDTNSVDLTLTGGVLSADVIISPNAGNQLQLLPDGLYVSPSTFSLTVTDTNTVDLTLVGGNLTADVIVSPNAGNALQVLPNGLYVGPGAYSLSDCAGNPLPVGTQVLRCPASTSAFNINDQLIASNPPGTALRTLSSKNCPEPANNDFIIIADNAGNVRYTQMREAVFHNLLAGNPIVFPNLPIVTLQPPNTTTGIIDSASFTNPRSCYSVFVKGVIEGILQHSFNQNNAVSTTLARISNLRDLISRIDNYNTPGITNTPLTGHAWRNQTVRSAGFSAERIIDLGVGIAPSSTSTFNRELFMQGATNFYYVTVEGWNASFNVFAL